METNQSDQQVAQEQTAEKEPKWDYTSNQQNLITGALVVAGNLLVVMLYVLYRTVPAVHQFISGKPM